LTFFKKNQQYLYIYQQQKPSTQHNETCKVMCQFFVKDDRMCVVSSLVKRFGTVFISEK
jgi:hypothetical protein